MDIDTLRNKWQEFLSASITAKYNKSAEDKETMKKKLEEFNTFWEQFKKEQLENHKNHK